MTARRIVSLTAAVSFTALTLAACADTEVRVAETGRPLPPGEVAASAPVPVVTPEGEARALGQALQRLVIQAEREGEYEAAAGHYRRLAQRLDDPAPAIAGEARMLRYAGRTRDAMMVLDRALERPELAGDRTLQLELAKARLAAGLTPDALNLLEALRAEAPGDADVLKVLALAYDRADRREEAHAAYETALAMRPGDVEAINNYALSLAMAGHIEQGIALLEGVGAAPDAPVQTRQNLAMLHALTGDMARAEAIVRDALPAELAERVVADLRRMVE